MGYKRPRQHDGKYQVARQRFGSNCSLANSSQMRERPSKVQTKRRRRWSPEPPIERLDMGAIRRPNPCGWDDNEKGWNAALHETQLWPSLPTDALPSTHARRRLYAPSLPRGEQVPHNNTRSAACTIDQKTVRYNP